MDFELSPRTHELKAKIEAFMDEYVYPNEELYDEQLNSQDSRWQLPMIVQDLKKVARSEGLWNLFLPDSKLGAGLTNVEYAPLCEIMGRVHWAPEIFNCSAPDTGNMLSLIHI